MQKYIIVGTRRTAACLEDLGCPVKGGHSAGWTCPGAGGVRGSWRALCRFQPDPADPPQGTAEALCTAGWRLKGKRISERVKRCSAVRSEGKGVRNSPASSRVRRRGQKLLQRDPRRGNFCTRPVEDDEWRSSWVGDWQPAKVNAWPLICDRHFSLSILSTSRCVTVGEGARKECKKRGNQEQKAVLMFVLIVSGHNYFSLE